MVDTTSALDTRVGGRRSDALPPCRSCGEEGLLPFLDLGMQPMPDNLLRPDQLGLPEPHHPLEVAFCPGCSLVQITVEVPPQQLFVDNYLYFSSFSDDLLRHSATHAEGLRRSRSLDASSFVVEVASNDGYLLRNFVDAGIKVLGVDPAPGQADAAERIGVPTLREFFGLETASRIREEHGPADVIIANNVMAHVPALNDFVAGLAHLVKDDGVITVENPYVRDLVDRRAFDTIYHEHFCYYSCTAVDRLVRRHGLALVDVQYFPDLHAGTLRWHLSKRDQPSALVHAILGEERLRGIDSFDYYASFARDVETVKRRLLELLHSLQGDGSRIAAYGAAAKGSTLLNYVGIGPDLVEFVVDRNTHKHGLLMPGTHIPVRPVEALLDEQPDHVLLLAWNFRDEVLRQQRAYLARGGRFVVPVPVPAVVP